MEETVQEKQDYGVFQFRLYTVKDEFFFKRKFTSCKEAKERMLQYLFDEQYGFIYSRGTIRYLNRIMKDWVVNELVLNPAALLFNTEKTVADNWKLTLYDSGDRVIDSERFHADIGKKQVEMIMINKNAVYAVVSVWDMDLKDFRVARIHHNQSFKLYVFGPNDAPAKMPQPGEDLMLAYARALNEDNAETFELLKKGYWELDI